MRRKHSFFVALATVAIIGIGYYHANGSNSKFSVPAISHILKHQANKGLSKAQERARQHKAYIGRNTLGNHSTNDQTNVASINFALSERTNVQVPNSFAYMHGKRKFVMRPLDNLGRAQGSHIQVSAKTLPRGTRPQRITVNPAGWHNYKFTVEGIRPVKYNWLYNRGHLVGYQFCGINSDKRNLITQTTYVNQGSLNGMNDSNPKGQLYYENKLRNWINTHPSDSLDYSVVPGYHGNELVPRYVILTFVGYNKNGKEISVDLHSKHTGKSGKYHYVMLMNTSPQAHINYATGRAKVWNANGSLASRG